MAANEETPYQHWVRGGITKGKMTCPLCQNDDWKTERPLLAPVAYDDVPGGHFVTTNDRAVLAPIVCQQCHYTVFLHGGVLTDGSDTS